MKIFDTFIQSLQKFDIKEVTEHTYRAELQDLLNSVAKACKANILIQHEPKKQQGFGAPDFKVKTSGEAIIGYVENKKLSDDLSKTVKGDQLRKYQSLSNNIILTNYIEWYWIKDGEVIDKAKLCSLAELESKMTFVLDPSKVRAVKAIITNFYSQAPKGIGRPKQLAEALAIRTRYLRDFLHAELERQEIEHQEGRLYGLYDTFKTNVFHELNQKDFADAFSQTLVYGLFLSKLNAGTKTIDLFNAKQYILPAFGLISELVDFLDVLHNDHYKDARWIVEEILSVMNTLDLKKITRNLSYEKFKTSNLFDEENISYKDPYIYFYEHFLAAYDKSLRKAKGVYYTPPQVVNFIVRSINDILKESFGIENGFADKDRVTVLDFATGTGSFLLEILEIIFEELPQQSGKKNLLIRDHILKNFYGFEYMIAPYAVANLKLSQFLKEQGYNLKDDDSFQIYLTNTLEPISKQLRMPLLPTLTKESRAAQKVKDNPLLVITGNPPYNINSKNNGEWILNLTKPYYYVDGKKMEEKNPKALRDDYVKFIRFAQHKMESVDQGVIGIITNHTFLFSSTFRGMRQSLINSFDQIYVINLHGNNKLKEKSPDGSIDENVFDIEQGVAISFFIKNPGSTKAVKTSDFWGSRKEKYSTCLAESVNTLSWTEITPKSPYYLLEYLSDKYADQYLSFIRVPDIFKLQGGGIKFRKDPLLVHLNRQNCLQMLRDLNTLSSHEIQSKYRFKETDDWKIDDKRKYFENYDEVDIQKISYRPFDVRFAYYPFKTINKIIVRGDSRRGLMRHLTERNYALQLGRAGNVVSQEVPWNLAFITNQPTDMNLFYRGGATSYPLYSYKYDEALFEINGSRKENIHSDFRNYIDTKYGKQYSPEQILGYIYAILHSNKYREKYSEFLKIDFPRIPFSEQSTIFEEVSSLGLEIISAHLMEKKLSNTMYPYGNFTGSGDNKVEKRKFSMNLDEEGIGRLYINNTQYFDRVPSSVYEFYIGGYQVLDKYLKDRSNRQLDLAEVDNLENTIRVLSFTAGKMKEIDLLTKDWI
ncbi:type ISP restriction/modification enzyme [Nafulsella turpanensis]|uniref:type ISP restriction/modification enzyme n=1 Tax=Nafulsella turpanensis TaxID=1265690 RepID=UPI00034AFB89|nr:type ISP restriction/modification enzyme [Nafulsella turpanensis]